MRTYHKSNAHLKHVDSWFRAIDEHSEIIELSEIYFERDTDGLVRFAKGRVVSEGLIRIGNRMIKSPCVILVTWSYLGKCTSWKGKRLPKYDLTINETAEQRRQSLNDWNLSHQPLEHAAHDTKK